MSDDYEDAGARWNINPNVLRGIEKWESNGRTDATSPAGAEGNAQFMPGTARAVGVLSTRGKREAIFGMAKLMHQNLEMFNNNLPLALAAYNTNPKTVQAYAAGKGSLPGETQKYIQGVPKLIAQFEGQNGAPTSPAAFNPATASDAEIRRRMEEDAATVQEPAAPAQPQAPSFNPATASDAEIRKRMETDAATVPAEKAAEAKPSTVRDQINAALQPGGRLGGFTPEEATAFTAGIQNAGRNVGITANRVIGDPLGILPGQTANRDAFNAQYGDNGAAQLGGMVGSTAATLPVMAAVNPLVARGVGAGVNALSSVAPGLASRAASVSDFLGGAFGGASAAAPARPVASTLSNAASGGLQGAEAAAINSGQSDQPLASQMVQGAALGAPIGAIPAAAGYAKNAISGASGILDPEIARVAQIARDQYGVQLKAPQLGLNPTLNYLNSTLKFIPGSGVGSDEAITQAQFQRAVAREMGENTDKIHGTTIAAALKRSGKVMNDVGARTDLNLTSGPPGVTPLDQLADVEFAAQQPISGLNEGQIKQVQSHINKIQDIAAANGGVIPGDTYLKLIRQGDALDQLTRHESSTMAGFGSKIRNALDDALQASATPEDAAALQQARYQYKVAKTVEPLTARSDALGGPRPSIGDINPVALRAAVLNPRAFGPDVTLNDWGRTPLWDLARIGQYMREAPQSGTAPREAIQNALFSMGKLGVAGAMGGAGYAGAEIPGILGGLAAGMTVGRGASAALRSQALANRMINSSANPLLYYPQVDPLTRSALAALAGPRANLVPLPEPPSQ